MVSTTTFRTTTHPHPDHGHCQLGARHYSAAAARSSAGRIENRGHCPREDDDGKLWRRLPKYGRGPMGVNAGGDCHHPPRPVDYGVGSIVESDRNYGVVSRSNTSTYGVLAIDRSSTAVIIGNAHARWSFRA